MTPPAAVVVDRSRLPQPGPVRPFVFPSIAKSTLPSGLRVWTVRHAQVPVVAFQLLVRRGSAADPAGREGLAAMTADMLDEGSNGRSAIEIHEEIARTGGQFDTDIGSDATLVSITSLSRVADRTLNLLADIVARPSLTDDDCARVRQLRLHRLTQLRDNPGAVADRVFLRTVYGDHPYGHTPTGSEGTVAAISSDDVRTFHAREIRPAVSTLVAVGDCEHDEIAALAADAFAGWTGGAGGSRAVDDPPGSPPRFTIVPRPRAPQSELRIGQVGAARHTPDYHALVAANMVLGGQFVSRLNLNLREHRGLTYGARTAFDFRLMRGPFMLQVSVQSNATAEAVREAIGEVAAIRSARPITAEELAVGVAALTRGYARSFETAEQIARAVMQLALYDLADDYFATFVPALEQVTPAAATDALARHLDPERLSTIIVGDLDLVGEGVSALAGGEPVVKRIDEIW